MLAILRFCTPIVASFFIMLSSNPAMTDEKLPPLEKDQENTSHFIEKFQHWNLYSQIENGEKTCFITSSPVEKGGTYKRRGDQFIWVRYINKDIDEVSITPGYPIKHGSYPELAVYSRGHIAKNQENIEINLEDNKCIFKNEDQRYMFDIVDKDQAWVRDIETDKKAISEMIRSNYAIVTAYSTRNSCSLDIYSLMGFTKAYNAMQIECDKK